MEKIKFLSKSQTLNIFNRYLSKFCLEKLLSVLSSFDSSIKLNNKISNLCLLEKSYNNSKELSSIESSASKKNIYLPFA